MRSRLGFAVGIMAEADLLLLDETLSVGDQHFREKSVIVMIDRINSEQTVVFVSHNATQVEKLCQRAIWIENAQILLENNVRAITEAYSSFIPRVVKISQI